MNDTFYIVDFDRTTADSDKLLDVFLNVVDHYLDLPREQVEAADADMKARGDSFDTASYVRDHLADQGASDEWDRLTKQFIHEAHSLNMLLPGAQELFAYLDERQLRYGILTYGNPLWQHLKLSAAGFNHVQRIVMTMKEKGVMVSSWRDSSGVFVLPREFGGGTARTIVMIDDKAVSFDNFPGLPSRGLWVVDKARMLPSQKGTVPDNVRHYESLISVVRELKSE